MYDFEDMYVLSKRRLKNYDWVEIPIEANTKFIAVQLRQDREREIYLLAPSGEYKGKYVNITSRYADPFITQEIKNKLHDKMIFFDEELREFM